MLTVEARADNIYFDIFFCIIHVMSMSIIKLGVTEELNAVDDKLDGKQLLLNTSTAQDFCNYWCLPASAPAMPTA